MNIEHIAIQALLRTWPFPRGAGRIIDRLFPEVAFKETVATVRTTDGFNITVLPNDLIGRHIYLTGEFDRTIVEVLCKLAKPGDTLLDIGANIGYVSACFLQNIPDSKTIAVEPQPFIVDLLRKNLAQFAGRQTIFPFALSDRDGIEWFQVNEKNLGAGRLVGKEAAGAIKIEVRSAEQLFETLPITKVDIVKLDVEGHEENVLRASKPHLQRLQPRAIIFEDNAGRSKPGGEIRSLLDDIGYNVFGIKKSLTKATFVPIASNFHCRDYVALRRIQ